MQQAPFRNTMPGAFALDGAQDAIHLPGVSGAKSHVFQPPQTPSTSAASSLYLPRPLNERPIVGTRKRSRNEITGTPVIDEWGSKSFEMTDPGSPMPFVNTKYFIAGGLDTPGHNAEASIYDGELNELGYRKQRSTMSRQSTFGDMEPEYFSNTDANGRPRLASVTMEDVGEKWSVARLVGGVVGKVWEFCKTNAFRGFHAGGGKAYDVSSDYTSFRPFESDVSGENRAEDIETAAQGSWTAVAHEDLDFIPDYIDRTTPDLTLPRPAKRRQVCAPKDDLTKNWVVVQEKPVTPTKPKPKAPARYSMSTASSASRRGAPRPTALPRPSLAPRRQVVQSQSRGSHAGSPALQPNSGASFASPRSPGGSRIPQRSTSPTKPESPSARAAAAEAQKWAAKKRKEEREADESYRRLDRQLKAMIKEGKEALGTKVSIEMADAPSKDRRWGA
ncbi:hypothetical protein PVAG01_01980 [Phlyctema vagabunda]|uniref:Uncharacterized protein n=1 Tax=Phlyctema vagabunda TaxID=108571 RepID=A0ABR4PYX4_9HELO